MRYSNLLKINFDELCTCPQIFGYSGVKEFWKFLQYLTGKYNRSTLDGTPEEVFVFHEALEIVKADFFSGICPKCKNKK